MDFMTPASACLILFDLPGDKAYLSSGAKTPIVLSCAIELSRAHALCCACAQDLELAFNGLSRLHPAGHGVAPTARGVAPNLRNNSAVLL
jgi:hypothetical protein